MIKTVSADYTLCYPDPLILETGDAITIYDEDTHEKWKGWHACEDSKGKKGWISETYFKRDNDQFVIIKDYNATELNAQKGEDITIVFEDCGWAWCKKSNGDKGWLPMEILSF